MGDSIQRQRLIETAGELAGLFAGRAARHDEEASFPKENYDDLREAGILRLPVPTELGGLGGGIADVVTVLERLATGDGATALAVCMHISPLGQWASVWRRTGNPRLAGLLRRAADGTLIWAAVTGERGVRNDMTDAHTQAQPAPGGFRLTGRKVFATNSAVATHFSTTARWADAPGGPRLLLCQVAMDQPGVSVLPTWNTMAMRATRSDDVVLDGVFVPDDAVVHSLPIGHLDRRVMETVWAWAMPAFSAVYIGIATAAVDWTVARVVAAGRADDPQVQEAVGECCILIEAARALVQRQVGEVADRSLFDRDVQAAVARSATVKYTAANNAVAVLQRLVDVVGGAALSRDLPFERWWRDVQAGTVMPMGNLATTRLVGADALGVATAPVTDDPTPSRTTSR